MNKTILLDVDGVLANFNKAACEVHGIQGFKPTEYSWYRKLSMTEEEFWKPIDTYQFWRTLSCFPWASDFIRSLSEIAPVVLSTSPSRSPECYRAKVEWIREALPPHYTDVMLGSSKELMASKDTILIDDSDSNVDKFREAGGTAILFPQPWNSEGHPYILNNMDSYIFENLIPLVKQWAEESEPESDRTGNPKDSIGSLKIPLHLVSPVFTAEVAVAKLNGSLKYGRNNYRAAPVRASIYIAAAKRHLDAWLEGEENDPEEQVHHLGAAGACLDILADARAEGTLIDDRNYKGRGYLKRKAELTETVRHLHELHADRKPRHWTKQDEIREQE